jgi:glycosyltransferase involved in cell wall biosynthesis
MNNCDLSFADFSNNLINKEIDMKKVVIYTQAYNSEKYIKKCIESVLTQTYKEFDYYLINNGSTDRTWSIISEYAKKDARIIPIHLESNTRFLTEKYAKIAYDAGYKYIVTLDSDDWFEPKCLEVIYNFVERENLDIAAFGTKFYYETGQIAYRHIDKSIVIEKPNFSNMFTVYHQFFRPVWGKIFKTEILTRLDFSDAYLLGENVKYGADTIFSIAALAKSNRIGIHEKILHNYRVHNKSVSYIYNEDRINSDTLLFENSQKFLKMFGEISNENYHFIYLVYLNAIKDTINTLLKSSVKIPYIIDELNIILGQPLTQQMFKYIKNDENLKIFKRELINMIIKFGNLKAYNSNIMHLIYKNICLLSDNVEKYIYEYEIEKHIKNTGYILYVLDIDKESLFIDNILLGWVKNQNFIIEYHEIIKDVYFKDFYAGLEKAANLLNEDNELKYKEELIYMCLNLAATLGENEVFVYAKKLQCQLFINEYRFNEAEKVLEDLTDMCPNDDDVIMLKKCLEEEYE